MGRTSLVGSLLWGLGVAVVITACGGDSISGPRTGLSGSGSGASGDSVVVVVDTTPPDPDSVTAAAMASAAESPPPPPPATPAPVGAPQPAVMRLHPLKKSITVKQVVGPRGGQIKIPQAGLTVVFSKGALTESTTITVTAESGSLVRYEFGPHGTQFQAPVAIEQDMSQTTIYGNVKLAATLSGGYLPDGVADLKGDSARVSEKHPTQTSTGSDGHGNQQMKQSVFVVWHFSGYILIGA
jgi:hypothetical protein